MGKLVDPDKKGLIEIISGSSDIDLTRPFSREIFLLNTYIAGTSYIPNIDIVVKDIEKGVKLKLYREPDNKHDELAIVIKDANDNKIGYVPRENNEILARLMDAGKLLYGVVKDIERIHNWYRIGVKIYLKD